MKYRAFVASTYHDFKEQRAHVIECLTKANLEVVAMEDWTTDPDHPGQLSASNIAGCHFCIAIIGFRRGTISTQDSRGRSITQIEIDTARAKGVRVLSFMLQDTEVNRTVWPKKFNELNDEKVNLWRQQFSNETTCELFNAGDKLDVLPAVTRQISKWERNRRYRLQRLLYAICLVIAAIIFVLLVSGGSRDWLLSRLHSYHDPVVFQHARDGTYKTARLLEGRSDILDNSNLKEEIAAAKDSFVMFANTIGSVRTHETDYKSAAKRGVSVRFVVTDFSELNKSNWESFQFAAENTTENITETKANAANMRQIIQSLATEFPGNFQYRLNRKPIFYTLWVRDPDSDSGMAHLGVHYYGKTSLANWPAIRVSRLTGGTQLKVLRDQFDTIWQAAAEDCEGK